MGGSQSYRNNPDYRKRELARKRLIYRKGRNKLLDILGGQCITCGVATDDLEIDHINNDGKQDREKHGHTMAFLKYYVTHPDEAKERLQILCKICHMRKTGADWWM